MIPRPYITEWRSHALWRDDAQVEQDLILSRLIIDFYNEPVLAENLCFRGGTALHKLFLAPAVRYSEDIDFVQKEALPIGIVMEKIREICNPLLGRPRTNQTKGRVVFIYRIDSEIPPVLPMKEQNRGQAKNSHALSWLPIFPSSLFSCPFVYLCG